MPAATTVGRVGGERRGGCPSVITPAEMSEWRDHGQCRVDLIQQQTDRQSQYTLLTALNLSLVTRQPPGLPAKTPTV